MLTEAIDGHTRASYEPNIQLRVLWHVQLNIVEQVVVVNMLSVVGSLVTQIPARTSSVVEPTRPSVVSKIFPAHWQSPRADRVNSLVNLGLLGLQRRARRHTCGVPP